MIVVTSGAGFIGSNLIESLNADGIDEVMVVDRLGDNFHNLSDLRFSDFMRPDEFLRAVRDELPKQSKQYFTRAHAPTPPATTAPT
jgi:ADP-L-glycero-D-manno-heptose 6-epimerase